MGTTVTWSYRPEALLHNRLLFIVLFITEMLDGVQHNLISFFFFFLLILDLYLQRGPVQVLLLVSTLPITECIIHTCIMQIKSEGFQETCALFCLLRVVSLCLYV